MSGYALAVDIGGTFTDVVLNNRDGRTWTDKTLTTHQDLLEGFFRATGLAMERAGISPGDVDDVVVHATTVVTNALIQRKGPPTALLVTEGFRDVLYIRDEHRYDMYDPQIEFAEPLVPRERTFTVSERVYADASVGKTVDAGEIREIATKLKDADVESAAVCLLNSYKNGSNEVAVRDTLLAELPDLYVSLSSEVAPQMREYLRASTTVINAFTEPITRPYLRALIEKLDAMGFPNEPLIMLSSGGIIGAEIAGHFPVRMIESGPAAGALVASYFARRFKIDNLVSFDMGGTTAKACIIQGGEPLVTGEFEVDRRYRFKPGSGMPITIPSIDMIEIGAGGGSIAWVDSLGLLKTGPESAGSEPGPVSYGRGGEKPCVTDADVVLGIIDAENFLGGDMKLDRKAAEKALGKLGEQLGVGAQDAALGVFSVVGESMAAAARAHATDRGIDYRGLPLLAFGGAGPVHACYVAELLESSRVIYPPFASVLSAFGTLVTPARLDLVHGALGRLGDIDWATVDSTLNELVAEGTRGLLDAGIQEDEARFAYGADMRYVGQQFELTVNLDDDPRKAKDPKALRRQYEPAYEALYGVRLDEMDVEIVSWRVTALGPDNDREGTVTLADKAGDPKAIREVTLTGGVQAVPVYDRTALAAGQQFEGPVIIEERETTIFVLPGWRVEVHPSGSIIAHSASMASTKG